MAESFAVFDAPNAVATLATGINNGGEVAGNVTDASQTTRGFLRHRDGNMIVFDTPNASSTANFFSAVKINDAGDVTGDFADMGNTHCFVRYSNGNFTAFDVPNGPSQYVQGINDGGEIVGYFQDASQGGKTRGFLRDRAGNIIIFDAPNASAAAGGGTQVTSINNCGEIAGYLQDASQGNKGRGFVRDRNGTVTVFDAPNASTTVGQGAWTTGIRDDGEIVGSFQDASQGKTRGFVRSH